MKLASVCLFLMILFCLPTIAGDDNPSEALFRDKCVKCHEVTKLEIKAKPRKPDAEIKDLSTNDFDDKEALTAYVKRESELHGKKHKSKFSGSDEELAAMVDWLWDLKTK